MPHIVSVTLCMQWCCSDTAYMPNFRWSKLLASFYLGCTVLWYSGRGLRRGRGSERMREIQSARKVAVDHPRMPYRSRTGECIRAGKSNQRCSAMHATLTIRACSNPLLGEWRRKLRILVNVATTGSSLPSASCPDHGWVDFDLQSSAMYLSAIFYLGWWDFGGTSHIEVNTTQLREVLDHPVMISWNTSDCTERKLHMY